MAPILKEADSTATATANTTAVPAAKSPNETPTRPQPVPLEIPVTVNGARTVEGSDKREPFSEATQTVLVFPNGAVIRIATPLAPGQLIFLTNEKTKKEVVCQVVKSKSGGSSSGYVELQFTEAAPAFWGLRLPGTIPAPPATAPAVPRPVVTPPAQRIAPAATPIAASPVPPPLAAPVTQIPVPLSAQPKAAATIPPPPPPPVTRSSAPPQPSSVPVLPASSVFVTPPPIPKLADPVPVQPVAPSSTSMSAPLVSVPPPPPINSETLSPLLPTQNPPIPPPSSGARDYAKEIESLFAVPQAPESSSTKPLVPKNPPPPPAASSPSTEELKQQAARLQLQLSTMLFTEAPAAPATTAGPSLSPKLESPAVEIANNILEIVQEEPKPAAHSVSKSEVTTSPKSEPRSEQKASAPARTTSFPTLSAKDEEVEIPAWLRPVSQHSAVASEPTVAEVTENPSSVDESVPLTESSSPDSAPHPGVAVFGGQLLAGDSVAATTADSGSKKVLFIGLAAAAVLLSAGGFWYYQQNHSPSAAPPTTQTATAPPVVEPATSVPASSTPVTPSRQPANVPVPSAPTNSAPAHTSPPPASPAPVTGDGHRSTEPRNPAPVEETKKPSLGEVHLAAPVVRGSGAGSASGEPLPSVETSISNSGAEALADVAHRKVPTAPLPVGGDVKPAQLIKSVSPVYPQIAKVQRISGNVTLDALIDSSGNVAELNVISGPPLLHQAALEAVKQWKYTPAQLNGTPTSTHLTVTVQFRSQ